MSSIIDELAVIERLYWQLRRLVFMAVAVVERSKYEWMYGLLVGPKPMAIVERWVLVEVWLYL